MTVHTEKLPTARDRHPNGIGHGPLIINFVPVQCYSIVCYLASSNSDCLLMQCALLNALKL